MAKTQYSDIDIQIRMMTDADYENMSAFSCGVDELDKFFRTEVKECVERRYLSAYCAFTESHGIVAAFTLMNDSIMIGGNDEKADFFEDLRLDEDENIVDFFKQQSSYPAINIGHLGTAIEYQGNGIGMAIIEFVAGTFSMYRQAGCQFITVDALNNPRTIRFYLSNGFSFQTNKDFFALTRRMYRIMGGKTKCD